MRVERVSTALELSGVAFTQRGDERDLLIFQEKLQEDRAFNSLVCINRPYLPGVLQKQLCHFRLYLNGALNDAIKFK